MSAATSGEHSRGMNTNTLEYYRAEIAYRREQMLRDQGPMRRWRRARNAAAASAPKNRHR